MWFEGRTERLRESDHCMLGETINGVGCNGHDASQRSSDKNVTRPSLDHAWDHCSCTKYDTVNVDVHNFVVIVVAQVLERKVGNCAKHVGVSGNASIETNDVKWLKGWHDLVPCGRVSDIEMHILTAYFNCNGFTESVVDVGNDNACALTGESASHLGANATCSTSNECSLSG